MFIARLTVVIIGIVATYCGLSARSLLGQILGAAQIRAVAGVVILISICWKKLDSNAAFWSLLAGGTVAAVWHFTGNPFDIVPLWPALAVCFAIMIPMTLLGKKPVSDGYILVQESIEKLLQEEKKHTEAMAN